MPPIVPDFAPEFVKNVTAVMMAGRGDGPEVRLREAGGGDIRALALKELMDIRRDQRSLMNRLGELENLLRDEDKAA